jgi:hypothetical protein
LVERLEVKDPGRKMGRRRVISMITRGFWDRRSVNGRRVCHGTGHVSKKSKKFRDYGLEPTGRAGV